MILLLRAAGGSTASVSCLNSVLNGFVLPILARPSFSRPISSVEYPIHSQNVAHPAATSGLSFSSAIITQPRGYFAFSSSISIFTLADPISNSIGSVTKGQGGP